MRGKDAQVEWMPFELRPYPTPTLRPEGEYLRTAWERSVYPLAEMLGVSIRLPTVSPQPYTHLAFEGFQFARERGRAREYNHRMFTAFFQESLDIGDITVLTTLARELGLDGEEYRDALETGRYREAHRRELEHAYREARIQSVPTFVIGGQVLRGLQVREDLEAALATPGGGFHTIGPEPQGTV